MGIIVIVVIIFVVYLIKGNIYAKNERKKEENRKILNIKPVEKKDLHYPIVLSPKNVKLVLPTQIHYYYDESPKRGASDLFFAQKLKKYFSNVSTDLKLGRFFPDIVLYNEMAKFYLDIEIDEIYTTNEVYNLKRKMVIHSMGDDDFRNNYFLNKGWYVLRFSEEQVRKETESCCKFVAQVYAYYALDKTPLNKLQTVRDLSFSEQWSKEIGNFHIRNNSRREWLN